MSREHAAMAVIAREVSRMTVDRVRVEALEATRNEPARVRARLAKADADLVVEQLASVGAENRARSGRAEMPSPPREAANGRLAAGAALVSCAMELLISGGSRRPRRIRPAPSCSQAARHVLAPAARADSERGDRYDAQLRAGAASGPAVGREGSRGAPSVSAALLPRAPRAPRVHQLQRFHPRGEGPTSGGVGGTREAARGLVHASKSRPGHASAPMLIDGMAWQVP